MLNIINKHFDLTNKIAIVTGAGNGIGEASAKMLAAYGAAIVVSDYSIDDATRVAKEIEANNGRAIAIKCDVTLDEDLTNLVEKTVEQFGQVNILVNNAGGGRAGHEGLDEIDISQFKRVFDLNVHSIWRLTQLCAPHMQAAGYGSIVNISSMASINKSPSISAYASSKAAINHLTANLAFDVGANVRINAIGPGAIKTKALAKVLTPEIEKRMLRGTPLQCLGDADDIAGAVLYFAAPISQWVSGQTLFVNGGGVQTLD